MSPEQPPEDQFPDAYETAWALFTGAWALADRLPVERTVEAIERRYGRSALPSLAGKPWVCICHEVRGRHYFMAHWSRRPDHVLTATTGEELSEQMRLFAALHP